METEKLASMVEVFEALEVRRSVQRPRHILSELPTVVVSAALSGADDFEAVLQWERAKLNSLRGFLMLVHGVASADTFERVFALLEPKGFERAFRIWVGSVIPALGRDQVIAINGKASRRMTRKAAGAPLHMVSAFAAEVGIVLGQTATGEKSNEITAIRALLRVSTSETYSRGHGLEELLSKAEHWRDLRTFAVVERTRTVGGRSTVERGRYNSSTMPDAERIAHAVRSHWEVESRLH